MRERVAARAPHAGRAAQRGRASGEFRLALPARSSTLAPGALRGFEALLRWRGLLLPVEFLLAAEAAAGILRIGLAAARGLRPSRTMACALRGAVPAVPQRLHHAVPARRARRRPARGPGCGRVPGRRPRPRGLGGHAALRRLRGGGGLRVRGGPRRRSGARSFRSRPRLHQRPAPVPAPRAQARRRPDLGDGSGDGSVPARAPGAGRRPGPSRRGHGSGDGGGAGAPARPGLRGSAGRPLLEAARRASGGGDPDARAAAASDLGSAAVHVASTPRSPSP